mmetsp:Transcript_9318/g.28212  ORF Transcript_9318/g.28212 Transcript_9318/m.28212 type:complete len:312 (-) Transcript_9318:488-1423(-)
MSGSFFHYSGNWETLKFDEIALDNGANSLFLLTANKLSSSGILRRRAQQAVEKNRAPVRIATPPADPKLVQQKIVNPTILRYRTRGRTATAPSPPPYIPKKGSLRPVPTGKSSFGMPRPTKPPPVHLPSVQSPREPRRDASVSNKPLYEVARQARKAEEPISSTPSTPSTPQAAQRKPVDAENAKARVDGPPPAPRLAPRLDTPAPVRDADGAASERVRATILETMKRGINQARNRTDLAPGEKAMLEHMKMYVMETKVAEGNLSSDELQIWNDIKAEYEKKSRRATEAARRDRDGKGEDGSDKAHDENTA